MAIRQAVRVMPRLRRLSISLPETLWDALFAEGSRTYEPPATIATRVLTEALPHYVARHIESDLRPVITAHVVRVSNPRAIGAPAELLPGPDTFKDLAARSPGPKPGASDSAIRTSSPIETLPRRHFRSRSADAPVS